MKKKKLTVFQKKYHKYLLSSEWKAKRLSVLNERGICDKCGKKKNLHVHHLTYDNIFHERPEDLIVLCKKCHFNIHNGEDKPKKVPRDERKRRAVAREMNRLVNDAMKSGKVVQWTP